VISVFWDTGRREAGRRRLDPGNVLAIAILMDAFAPAVGEVMFQSLQVTQGNQFLQIGVIVVLLGVI
ncbi:MAG: hypothetical protein ACOC1G_01190, partial [Phycisphaeraceae bacterium]